MNQKTTADQPLRPPPPVGGRRFGPGFGLVALLLLLPGLIGAQPRKVTYRQPAYISNAYFSDKMSQKGENVQPLSVVKALQIRPAVGVQGYFILDLVLTAAGVHHFKVDIMDQTGNKVTELLFPPVQVRQQDELPLYTAAGAISGELEPGLWFLKVHDQVNKANPLLLGTFAVMIMEPAKE